MPNRTVTHLTKIELAEIQLNRSIKLLAQDGDVVSAITLSGAADDIIWKALEARGQKSQLTEITELMEHLLEKSETPFNKPEFYRNMHLIRTELKHFESDLSLKRIPIPHEAALEIINRCCENYRRLLGKYPSEMHLLEKFDG